MKIHSLQFATFSLLAACGSAEPIPAPVAVQQSPAGSDDPVLAPEPLACTIGAQPSPPMPTATIDVLLPPPDLATAEAQLTNNPSPNTSDERLVFASALSDVYRERGDEASLQEAVRTLAQLIQSDPEYARMDDVLFLLGWGLTTLRQHDRARMVYHRLIQQYPQSEHVAESYLIFGEYYLRESEPRPAFRFAERAVQMASGPAKGYATYMLAWAMYQRDANPIDPTNLREARRELRELSTPIARQVADAIEADWCP
ncbi:MAG: tetratricopeptide repeat protein [Myxococcota bacterium]